METDTILLGLAWYFVFVLSLTCHEAAHAFVSHQLGDSTAYRGGLVSLSPIEHIRREPFGMVIFPIITYFTNGWMIGWASTPYDPNWARRFPKREIMMALAGPAANLILVIIAVIIIRVGVSFGVLFAPDTITFSHVTEAEVGGWFNSLAIIASILFSLNLILFVFNLMPLPPLDGSALIPIFLSERNASMYKMFISRPGFAIAGLIIAWQVFDFIFSPIHLLAINLLYPGAHYG
ncbi:MAG: hypothetical protein A2Y12_11205 [Planctomycetes bacterium GWF2_42_9]|nr:MAG: hypothetical protein A2Y12_11205 [Planctomycetes bacterium GWF2_42_9]HAL45254.1 hypothetical protein [Phycisphaerales bacterium]